MVELRNTNWFVGVPSRDFFFFQENNQFSVGRQMFAVFARKGFHRNVFPSARVKSCPLTKMADCRTVRYLQLEKANETFQYDSVYTVEK